MAPASHDGKKKIKKPPTFQHLPEHRAKKLKKEWVEKQKIQSKWRAQKKREGIVTLRDARKFATVRKEEGGEEGQRDEKDEDVVEDEDDGMDEVHASSDRESSPAGEALEPEPAPIPSKRKRRGKEAAKEEEELSLRELQRRAYSRDTLHHHKAGRGEKAERGNRGHSRGASRGSSGRGRGRGSDRGRGGRGGRSETYGGQPDMRLRMTALLEKIKHDVAQ